MVFQEGVHHRFVLFGLQRACGVNQGSTILKMLKGPFQQSLLKQRELPNLFGLQSPANLWVALQRSSTRTRRVDQNLVKPPDEWKRQGCIASNPAQILPILRVQTVGNLKPVPMKIQ